MFMALLADALEADRLIKRTNLSVRSKASAKRFKQLFLSDLNHAMFSLEPLERVHRERAAHTGVKSKTSTV